MKDITIELRDMDSADEFYKRLEEQFPLPAYFGYNLDALHDVFTEYSGELRISFTGADDAAALMPKFIRGLKRMCADAMEENNSLEFEFI